MIDSDAIRAYVNQQGGAVIPPKANREIKPDFDECLYRERHRIENLCARLKAYRRIATRYEKLHATFAPFHPSAASSSGSSTNLYLPAPAPGFCVILWFSWPMVWGRPIETA